ncbi:hypothetical protein LTR15_010681 [Elasticomyces elasticus]|nr:hypothetical protein LTR15_010681 [Elasticomyces elasticus]
MPAIFFDKLATEIRLQIYKDVLRCDTPLEHFQTLVADKDTRHILRKMRGVHTAILRVSRQAYAEALPVFFECNAFVVRHRRICRSLRGQEYFDVPFCEHKMVRTIIVRNGPVTASKGKDMGCCDRHVVELVENMCNFAANSCPKLQYITLRSPLLEYGSGRQHDTLSGHLREHGFKITCTRIRQLKLKRSASQILITLEDNAMHKA